MALIAALLDPRCLSDISARSWNEMLVQARDAGVLGRLEAELDTRGLIVRAPAKARDHLHRGSIAAESSRTAVRYEMNRVRRAIGNLNVPLILLKGGAYLAAELPPARGRVVGDLDFMVPRARIGEVEQALREAGWASVQLDPYDERYYREYAHEIPPLLHPDRQTPLDVHHTIVPLTSRLRPDAEALQAASIRVGDTGWRVLAPADMVLHSAVHLFNDEVGKPLRDLFDLHDLLTYFGKTVGFWDELIARARLHQLGRPLYYALRYTRQLLDTPVPNQTWEAAQDFAPAWPTCEVMDRLFTYYFLPEPLDETRRGAALARWILYVRTHWLRMPPALLAR
ncbi:MAG: nucleotidyltransferase family protein, partial [Vicinamibacterales bacterium]